MKWVITDELMSKLLNADVKIYGKVYRIDPDCKDFKVGDVVLDRADGSHCVVDMIMDNGNYVVTDRPPGSMCGVVEGHVSADRLLKCVLKS